MFVFSCSSAEQVLDRSAALCYDRIVKLLDDLRKRSNEDPKTLEEWLRGELREYGLTSGTCCVNNN